MLFVLRQLRRLELRKRSGQYFLYAFGEIVLIVVGILLALQISNWNDRRVEQQEVQEYLESLHEDFRENIKEVDLSLERISGQIEDALQLRDFLAEETITADRETLNELLVNIFATPPLNQSTKAFNALINAGGLRKISNKELRSALGSWETGLEDARSDEETSLDHRNNVAWFYITDHLAFGEIAASYKQPGYHDFGKIRFKNDFEELKNNRAIDNLIVERMIINYSTVTAYKHLREAIVEVNRLLDEELNK